MSTHPHPEDDIEKYFDKLQILNQSVWDSVCNKPQINKWLELMCAEKTGGFNLVN
ncbi:hypothetical protein KTG70_05150 [Acinetobacter variabilis]|uniref:hypothetical protein n=1 Tax=Acinetobacter variabilis TaxID=70346 RepID=UPI0021CD2AE4|nr:hypothetical protein [Acinetobacter variabilis]MCU4364569.1 hypothetical protein [Acinetobacter variabilis]MCU4374476.1 hypothetical protein [Acinetobacter variabilis]